MPEEKVAAAAGHHAAQGLCWGVQVEERFHDHRSKMGLLELGVMLWAFAKAGHLSSRIFEAAVPTILEQCGSSPFLTHTLPGVIVFPVPLPCPSMSRCRAALHV